MQGTCEVVIALYHHRACLIALLVLRSSILDDLAPTLRCCNNGSCRACLLLYYAAVCL